MKKPSLLAAELVVAATTTGCGGGDTSGKGGAGGGTGGAGGAGTTTSSSTNGSVLMSFAISNGAKQNAALVDPLKGIVYGSLYKQEDVTAGGPIAGAVEVTSVEVADVDLTSADVSAATWSGKDIPEGAYTFLGFWDLDANGSATFEPDSGDPVTLPSANKLDVTADQETVLTATFDLILN